MKTLFLFNSQEKISVFSRETVILSPEKNTIIYKIQNFQLVLNILTFKKICKQAALDSDVFHS